MTAGQQSRQRLFDDALLTENDRADRAFGGGDPLHRRFGATRDAPFEIGDGGVLDRAHVFSNLTRT